VQQLPSIVLSDRSLFDDLLFLDRYLVYPVLKGQKEAVVYEFDRSIQQCIKSDDEDELSIRAKILSALVCLFDREMSDALLNGSCSCYSVRPNINSCRSEA
jgi:hypothetical protein